MKLLPLFLSAALAGITSAQETCNIQSPDIDFETLISGSFSQYSNDELKVVPAAKRDGSRIELTSSSSPGSITAAWFLTKERLGDGFSATFDFKIEDGTADGFAFVVQNDRTVNAVSDGGSALGFSDAVASYFAVGFDVCSDRNSGTCNVEQVFFESKTAAGVISSRTSITLSSSIKDGNSHSATFQYLADVDQVVVTIGSQILNVANVPSLEEQVLLESSKFAFFGFTASNSFITGSTTLTASTISLGNLAIVQMNSGTRLDPDSLVPKQLDFGKTVTYTYLLVDTCNDPLEDDSVSDDFLNDILPKITATLTPRGIEGRDPEEPTLITQDPDQESKIIIVFTTPVGVEAVWDLEIRFDEILAQKNPVLGIVSTIPPGDKGLKPLGIGLLAALIAVLVIAVILIVRGLRNYQKKLKEHGEDIEYGKTKQKVDQIDKTIDYNINPMVADLDTLKERLAANENTIKQLKSEQRDALDSDHTVQQLQEENVKLREEMNELKKKQEFAGAGNRISTAIGRRFFGGNKKDKLAFDQTGA